MIETNLGRALEMIERELVALRLSLEKRGDQPLTLRFGAAARRLSISVRTLQRMVTKGAIVPVLVNGTPMIPVSELHRVSEPGHRPLGEYASTVKRRLAAAETPKLKAGRLKRKNSTLADELAELKAGRKQR